MHRKKRSKVAVSFRVVGGAAAIVAVLLAVLAGFVAPLAQVGFSTVLSGSMVPAFAPGDLLVTRPIPDSSLRIGQVALLVPAGETTPRAHRVIALSGTNPIVVTTQGDANSGPDAELFALTSPEVRVVQAAIPGAGLALQVTQNAQFRATLIALIGLVITGSILRIILRPRQVLAL